jgi:hypothetical protein
MKVFLSHKQQFAMQADELHAALKLGVPGATVFLAEDIDKGKDWRKMIDDELGEAKCFVLLYTSPEMDWSWCFYEAGRFLRKGHKVACLHPKNIKLPSPLANLQNTTANQNDIRKWLESDFFRDVRSRRPAKRSLDRAVKKIEGFVNDMPAREGTLKPYIWIAPKKLGDWSDGHKINFSNALVDIDPTSARELGLNLPDSPQNLELLPFLRQLESRDPPEQPSKQRDKEVWIKKFFESLQSAVSENTNFQEEAYFRHKSAKILRPVVVGYARSASDTICRLRVIFADAFGTPLIDSPGKLQRLVIGARLAVRTQLEILAPFIHELQNARGKNGRDIGGRIVETLDNIVREAEAHGLKRGGRTPKLYDGSAQRRYKEIRDRGTNIWPRLERAAKQGDRTGNYSEAKRLLLELQQINEDYLALALPRIEELLVPVEKSRVRQ